MDDVEANARAKSSPGGLLNIAVALEAGVPFSLLKFDQLTEPKACPKIQRLAQTTRLLQGRHGQSFSLGF